jgi:hypothetical protein
MGWTTSYDWSNAEDVKRALLDDYAREADKFEVLGTRSTSYGRHFWMAIKIKNTGRSFVCLFLLGGGFREGWGFKDVSEDMGPVDIDCPVELLDMTDEPTEGYAVEWRKRVRAAAEARKGSQSKSFKRGDKCLIYGKTYVVVSQVKRSYIVSPEGKPWQTYKCGPSKMKPYLTPEQVAAADKFIESTM